MRITTINSGILLFLFLLIVFIIDNTNAQQKPKEVVTEGKPKTPTKKPKKVVKWNDKEPDENVGLIPKIPSCSKISYC